MLHQFISSNNKIFYIYNTDSFIVHNGMYFSATTNFIKFEYCRQINPYNNKLDVVPMQFLDWVFCGTLMDLYQTMDDGRLTIDQLDFISLIFIKI